ncbi:MAG: hypothetical protein Q7R93_00240 [bacterium]|nr:hypothetical protein [bacterium]
MPDEVSTPPPDTQAPPSEPVSAPVIEPTPPQAAAPAPETPPTETPAQAEVSESVPESTPEPSPSAQGSGGTQQAQPEPTPQPQRTANTKIRPHGDLVAANAKIQATKQKRLDKIMSRLSEKGKITNDEVEKLLRVSDATATRYLDALEKENRIKQTGTTGTGVFYEKL